VEEGQFRQDLYYRLNVIQVHIPPLRERLEDIPVLVAHFLDKLARQVGQPGLSLDANALQALQQYAFPGNVREMENILERASTLCEGNTITGPDLQLPEDTRTIPAPPAATAPTMRPGAVPLDTYMDNIEKDALLKALEQTRYNKTAAARLLGITFRALRYRLKKLGLE
jgi:two-component system response regulator PilR (NtrC family)